MYYTLIVYGYGYDDGQFDIRDENVNWTMMLDLIWNGNVRHCSHKGSLAKH